MKNLLLLFVALLSIIQATAQAPQKFNYQGIARNAQGEAMANQNMALKIGILSAADAEVPDYEEIHQVKTNEFGLYTLEIGGGEAVTGTMASVRWETGNKYVRVAIDPQGGNNFDVVGTNQLLSVPYALYSDKAGMARKVSNTLRGGQANYLSKFDSTGSSSSEIQSVMYDNGNNVGIGTTTPLAKIHVQANGASLQGMRIQNLNPTGVGRFLFYNDSTNSYGTMTKYGTSFPGQPSGLAGLYPYANLWTFGNNAIIPNDGTGRTLISSAGNVGISYIKNGAFKLKFHADYNSGNVGIGGNITPRAKIHLNNTDSTYINLMLSTNTTGHTPTDGLNIAVENKDASIINRENGSLIMGTLNTERMRVTVNGNVGIGTATPNAAAITEMSSTTQGFLPPRMTTVQRNAINSPANGLIIFNITTGCLNYCFSGTWFEWCGNLVATIGTINTINCAGAVHTGTLTASQPASGVSSNINYTGGNGGVHGGQTVNSTGVTGLTATLAPGNFATGAGTLTYNISGTPSNNGTASFAIVIGGKTCTLNRTVALPQPSVATLNCANATNTGTLQQGTTVTGVTSSIPYTGGNGIAYNGQTINSTGVTGLTATLAAGTLANGAGNLVYTITGTPNSSGNANFNIVLGGQTCTLTRLVTINATYPAGSVFCNGTPTAVVDVTNPITGRTWMDRNLGASQAANSSTDTAAYGDLYQWGRGADGHQCRNSGTITNLSSTDQPGNGYFILTTNLPQDWRDPQNSNLWQGINGINNPCPSGYRLPNSLELEAERLSWISNNSFGAYTSQIKLPQAGMRSPGNGNILYNDIVGSYWGIGSTGNIGSYLLVFDTVSVSITSDVRSKGQSVRCIKEITGSVGLINCGNATTNGVLTYGIPANNVSGTIPYTGGNGGYYPTTTINSTGVTGLTATITQDLFVNGAGNLNYTITGTPASGGVASFALSIGGQSCTFTRVVNPGPAYPAGSVYCNNMPTVVVDIVNPITGKIWMDRNLGASMAAVTPYDTAAYGDLYQWGRGADGHQCRNSATTSQLSSTDQPGNNLFILSPNTPSDWRIPQNDSLWQGVFGINNPCPSGYRIPSFTELNNEKQSWNTNNVTGALNNPLKVPLTGLRNFNTGLINDAGTIGYYATSTLASLGSPFMMYMSIFYSNTTFNSNVKANGYSVRCMKELVGTVGSIDCGSATISGSLVNGFPANNINGTVPYTGGNGGYYPTTTINSTGVTGLTATITSGFLANGAGSFNYTISGTPTSIGVASFVLNIGGQTCTFTRLVYPAPSYPVGTVHCNGTPTVVVDVMNPLTGKTWMDRNLGATQAATSSTDSLAFGDLYQWGRGADGHQCRNSPTTTILSSTNQPGNGNFILTNIAPNDWRSPQNDNLWQGVNGVNNPCPSGYRLPSEMEMNAERLVWSTNNGLGAFTSTLKLPMPGYRDLAGMIASVGSYGGYWSSAVSSPDSYHLVFNPGFSNVATTARSFGLSVRCIKN